MAGQYPPTQVAYQNQIRATQPLGNYQNAAIFLRPFNLPGRGYTLSGGPVFGIGFVTIRVGRARRLISIGGL